MANRNITMEFQGLQEEDGKNIAVISLDNNKENEDNSFFPSPGWRYYFEGSTGGSATVTKLTENLLQRKYHGEWVDGVRFIYTDEAYDFIHVAELADIILR